MALIFCHIPSLCTVHSKVWDDLQYAWRATFHTELSDIVLDTWPTTGPHAFSALQSDLLTETLLYLKTLKPGPALRWRAVQASPATAPAKDFKEGEGWWRSRQEAPGSRSRAGHQQVPSYSHNHYDVDYITVISFLSIISLVALIAIILLIFITAIISIMTINS